MTEHPILFQDRLVRAILDGRKTQTRRLVRPALPDYFRPLAVDWFNPVVVNRRTEQEEPGPEVFGCYDEDTGRRCPYGGPGDRLWVREAHAPSYGDPAIMRHPRGTGFRADWHPALAGIAEEPKWKPSIHMRREDARIFLEVQEVRVERLQDITEADAQAEGVERVHEWQEAPAHGASGCGGWLHPSGNHCDTASDVFRDLWDSINGERPGASWASNPWVWAITFRRVLP